MPSNTTDEFADQRAEMVRRHLEGRGIRDRRVLQAMREVPREEFVGELYRDAAYDDNALPIESGQTISQPFTVAFMCEAAQLSDQDKVLEVGTGSGYGAAVLGRLCREVHTVERIPALSKMAADRLQQLGFENVHVHTADGTLGVPNASPFDAIVVTAGAESLPETYVDQLADGGRIVIPLGTSRGQIMYRFTLYNGELHKENLGYFAFVPLVGSHGWRSAPIHLLNHQTESKPADDTNTDGTGRGRHTFRCTA